MNSDTIVRMDRAIERASLYLLKAQLPDGHWEDYELPVGNSDSWVTAYVGWSLALAWQHQGLNRAQDASEHAARWIVEHRYADSGWGYNAITGPDADSTGIAIALLQAHEMPVAAEALTYLRGAWTANGGFATFPGRQDGWGCAHVDVSWPAFGALSHKDQVSLGSTLVAWLRRERGNDGLWPGYWWVEPYYTSYHAELAAMSCGICIGPHQIDISQWRVDGMAAIAFCAGLLNRWKIEPVVRERLITLLLDSQMENGAWPDNHSLRVTDPSAQPSDQHPLPGPSFCSQRALVSTAGIMRVLASEDWA